RRPHRARPARTRWPRALASPPTHGRLRLQQCGSHHRCCTTGPTGNGEVVPEATFDELIEAMKAGAGILQQAEIPFVLGGGLAAWARGGPKSEHDVDFLLRAEDADAALAAFEQAGLETERPPEGWLYKAWHPNGTLVDLIFSPAGGPITTERIDGAPLLEVAALRVHV